MRGAEATDVDHRLLRRGLRLEYLTVGWMTLEAAVAIASGIVAHSIALVGFGLDSVIELFAGSVLIWQLRNPTEETEDRARRLIAVTFFLLAVYVLSEATRDLVSGSRPDQAPAGIILAVAALLLMPALGISKRRTALQLHNEALQADAAETLFCAWLAVVLLVGLLLNAALGWWWADPIAGVVIGLFAVREGWETWRGE
jgi:divalent metal cation (Fe/Co/Zn/Cd) transporter